ncbi:hypothetical protein C8R44DRAFT_949388, partial [Mycena epipterygia]
VFEKRLNPPEVLPTQFDSVQHSINIIHCLLPATTVNNTPEGFFTEKWNEDDMGRLKTIFVNIPWTALRGRTRFRMRSCGRFPPRTWHDFAMNTATGS